LVSNCVDEVDRLAVVDGDEAEPLPPLVPPLEPVALPAVDPVVVVVEVVVLVEGV
jgi:hypothetical protein